MIKLSVKATKVILEELSEGQSVLRHLPDNKPQLTKLKLFSDRLNFGPWIDLMLGNIKFILIGDINNFRVEHIRTAERELLLTLVAKDNKRLNLQCMDELQRNILLIGINGYLRQQKLQLVNASKSENPNFITFEAQSMGSDGETNETTDIDVSAFVNDTKNTKDVPDTQDIQYTEDTFVPFTAAPTMESPTNDIFISNLNQIKSNNAFENKHDIPNKNNDDTSANNDTSNDDTSNDDATNDNDNETNDNITTSFDHDEMMKQFDELINQSNNLFEETIKIAVDKSQTSKESGKKLTKSSSKKHSSKSSSKSSSRSTSKSASRAVSKSSSIDFSKKSKQNKRKSAQPKTQVKIKVPVNDDSNQKRTPLEKEEINNYQERHRLMYKIKQLKKQLADEKIKTDKLSKKYKYSQSEILRLEKCNRQKVMEICNLRKKLNLTQKGFNEFKTKTSRIVKSAKLKTKLLAEKEKKVCKKERKISIINDKLEEYQQQNTQLTEQIHKYKTLNNDLELKVTKYRNSDYRILFEMNKMKSKLRDVTKKLHDEEKLNKNLKETLDDMSGKTQLKLEHQKLEYLNKLQEAFTIVENYEAMLQVKIQKEQSEQTKQPEQAESTEQSQNNEPIGQMEQNEPIAIQESYSSISETPQTQEQRIMNSLDELLNIDVD